MKKTGVISMVFLLISSLSSVFADDNCESVRGRITSQVVNPFSNGEPCPGPLFLCTEGRYTGDLKGRFTFIATSLRPFAMEDPNAPQDVAATNGVIRLKTRVCDGELTIRDTSAFVSDPAGDGYFAGLGTIDVAFSSGECAGLSGRIRTQGVFIGGCVDCKYVGEICGLGDDDDDDDEDDD